MPGLILAFLGILLLVKGGVKVSGKSELPPAAARTLGAIALLPALVFFLLGYFKVAVSDGMNVYLGYVAFGFVLLSVFIALLFFRREIGASASPLPTLPPTPAAVSVSPSAPSLSPQATPIIVFKPRRNVAALIISAVTAVIVIGIALFYFFPSTFDYVVGKIAKLTLPKLSDELTEKADIPQDFKLTSVIPAVVQLNCDLDGGFTSVGSGVSAYFPDGKHWIMTNAHVVRDENGALVENCWIYFPNPDGTFYESAYFSDDIVPFDQAEALIGGERWVGLDYAVLRITAPGQKEDGTFFPRLRTFPDINRLSQKTCKKERKIEIGEKLFILGYPGIGGRNMTVTEGIVSGFDSPGFIKTSAKIEHGNSGGIAILEKDGCTLGIPTSVVLGELESIGGVLSYAFIDEFIKAASPSNTELYNAFTSESELESDRAKARDARRVADVRQLQLADELYFDATGAYAASLEKLAPDYLNKIPVDPLDGAPYYYYRCASNSYHLGANLENSDNPALQNDDDKTKLCASDRVNGGDGAGCDGTTNRRFCFDVFF